VQRSGYGESSNGDCDMGEEDDVDEMHLGSS
jgi:hypothetical protein